MASYRVETVVSEDGKIVLAGQPFRPGEHVKVTVTKHSTDPQSPRPYPLRGKPLRYDRPFDAVE